MTEKVYILQHWPREPVYHVYGRIAELDIARTGDVTKCGLVLYDGESRYSALLRRDHADLFARACSKCFPAPAEEPKP